MRVLVTGGSGFLGRRVVSAIAARGHQVVALVRSARTIGPGFFPDGVEVVRGDLRARRSLPDALEGVDAVVHLAACVVGDDDAQFASTVVGTENLLDAMRDAGVQRLVHCSTFSVYDWTRAKSPLEENSPLESDLYKRDGYAISKTWQERLARRFAEETSSQLTVLRPGFIWGPGAEESPGVGQTLGPFHIVFGGARRLPVTHVENCAEAFAAALDAPGAVGQTLNIVDEESISAWRYHGDFLRSTKTRGWRVYVPYAMGIGAAHVATWVSKWFYRGKGKLPGVLMPNRFRARFRPLTYSTDRLQGQLGLTQKVTYRDAWAKIAQASNASTAT